MSKYGLGSHLVLSENKIQEWALPAYSGNIVSFESDIKKSSIRDILSELTPVIVVGQTSSSTLENCSDFLAEALFKNSDLGLYLNSDFCQINPPVKSTSTLKQILNNHSSEFLELQTFIKPKASSRRIIVSEVSKKTVAISIPFSVVCYVEKSRTLAEIYPTLINAILDQVDYIRKCALMMKLENGEKIVLQRFYNPLCVLSVLIPIAGEKRQLKGRLIFKPALEIGTIIFLQSNTRYKFLFTYYLKTTLLSNPVFENKAFNYRKKGAYFRSEPKISQPLNKTFCFFYN
jgi:hypothetical protein